MSLSLTKSGDYHLTVYYDDTDFTGFVYHANYLRYFERAREELLGVDALLRLYKSGFHFVVKDLELDYRKGAHYGDRLCVKTVIEFDHPALLTCRQDVHRPADSSLLVTASVRLVTLNGDNRPVRVPMRWVSEELGVEAVHASSRQA